MVLHSLAAVLLLMSGAVGGDEGRSAPVTQGPATFDAAGHDRETGAPGNQDNPGTSR